MTAIEEAVESYCRKNPRYRLAIDQIADRSRLPNGRLRNNDNVLSDIREMIKRRQKPKGPSGRRESR
jgi:hypothetical protein